MSIVQDQKYICKQNANRAFFNVKKQGSPLLSFSKTTASHISTSFHYHKIRLFINVPETLTIIRLKGKSQNRCFKRTKYAKYSKKTNISYPRIRIFNSRLYSLQFSLKTLFLSSLLAKKCNRTD